MSIPVPSGKYFELSPELPEQRQAKGGYQIDSSMTHGTRSKDGELLSHFENAPLPRKGCTYPEGLMACNKVKKITLALFTPFACKEMMLPAIGFLFTPFKWKIRFLERYLDNYFRLTDQIFRSCERVPYLKKEYYNNFSKAIWDFIQIFLAELGITSRCTDPNCKIVNCSHKCDDPNCTLDTCSQPLTVRIAKTFAVLFEYDDLYRLMIEDPMSEFTKEEFLKHPARSVRRCLKILIKRVGDGKGDYTTEKFKSFAVLFSLALYHPKIKKAFREALKSTNFEWFKLDEYEIYWNLGRKDYNLQSRDLNDRFGEQLGKMKDFMEKRDGEEYVLGAEDPDNYDEVKFYKKKDLITN